MFTHFDEFTKCYQDSDKEEITSRYTGEFLKAVTENGKGKGEVFFVDRQAVQDKVILNLKVTNFTLKAMDNHYLKKNQRFTSIIIS